MNNEEQDKHLLNLVFNTDLVKKKIPIVEKIKVYRIFYFRRGTIHVYVNVYTNTGEFLYSKTKQELTYVLHELTRFTDLGDKDNLYVITFYPPRNT